MIKISFIMSLFKRKIKIIDIYLQEILSALEETQASINSSNADIAMLEKINNIFHKKGIKNITDRDSIIYKGAEHRSEDIIKDYNRALNLQKIAIENLILKLEASIKRLKIKYNIAKK